MSVNQCHFSLFFVLPLSGISIVNRTGPLIEAWNKKHDRNASLQVCAIRCGGIPLDRDNAFMNGTEWEIELRMAGPLANNSNMNDISDDLLAAVHAA